MISFLFTISQSVRVLLVFFYVGCIAALSLLPPDDLPKVPLVAGADKLVHFLMYLIFSILLSWTLKTEIQYPRLFFVISVTIGWGLIMEYLQLSMQAGRSFSWFDILANCLGVISGILFYVLASRKLQS